MGGGVSKIEYERVRKELLLKDQVIRTLQQRLDGSFQADGSGSVGDARTESRGGRSRESFATAAAPSASPPHDASRLHRDTGANLTLPAATKVSRLSYAVTTPGATLPMGAFLPKDDALIEADEDERLNSVAAMKSVDSSHTTAAEVPQAAAFSRRRIEVSAEVISKRQILAAPSQRAVHPKSTASKQLLLEILRSNVLFTGLSSAELDDCLDAFFPTKAAAGALVIRQGAQGDNFYAVERGELEILVAVNGAPPIRYGVLGTGQGFGELALLHNMPRAATIRAVTAVDLWALERNTFREILASHKLQRLSEALRALRNVSLLNQLTTGELQQVAAAMEWEEYPANTAVIRQGEVGEHFFVITRGEILVTQVDAASGAETTIRTMAAGDHFGEMALFKDEVRSATCTTVTPAQCLTLGREHFIAMLGTLEELMDRDPPANGGRKASDSRVHIHRRTSTESGSVGEYKYYMQIPKDELEILQTLGRGAFGRVKLVRHAATSGTFALKCLVKSRIVENNLREHVLNEKRVMEALDHPFILRLFSTYKDRKYLYFLVELALGGELFTYLRRRDRFEEPVARFYIASVVLVFQHMHAKSIAYRDLKPENILLDTDGFMKLADFGLAKVVTDRTWTLCGTPDYLAPEIILNKGHDKAVDYWALGILLFELLAGSAPFFAHDPMQIYALIIQGGIRFPSHFGCVNHLSFVHCVAGTNARAVAA